MAIAEDSTCPFNASVTDRCPSGSMPGILKQGRNSCTAEFCVHQRGKGSGMLRRHRWTQTLVRAAVPSRFASEFFGFGSNPKATLMPRIYSTSRSNRALVLPRYTVAANRTLAILLTGESEDLGAKGFSHWRACRRLFLTYAAAGRTMEGRNNLELQLIDHKALKVDSKDSRSQGSTDPIRFLQNPPRRINAL